MDYQLYYTIVCVALTSLLEQHPLPTMAIPIIPSFYHALAFNGVSQMNYA
jgi:hypothetical protein